MDITIYHNPKCGTSRNVLGYLRDAGIEPNIVEYLKTPLTKQQLKLLIARMGVPIRDVMRRKGTPYDELDLDNEAHSDDALIDFMVEHPILLNRPIVDASDTVKLYRPSETVLELVKTLKD